MANWANPNDFTIVCRLTNSKYADAFLNNGAIKFNTPQSWINYSATNGEGRGDSREGTIAFCKILDVNTMFNALKGKYSSNNVLDPNTRPLCPDPRDGRLYLKDKRSLKLPCFCLYTLKNSMFPSPDSPGKHTVTTEIPASYFRDFSEENQSALIIINDFNKFENRLYKALRKLGLKDNEILIGNVTYYDFEKYGKEGWFDFNRKYPEELFIKSLRFKEQSEARIIIKTRKKDIIKHLIESPIELGCMRDIAKVHNGYLSHGVHVKMTVNIGEDERIM